jgi:hypothetical protein
MERSLWQVTTYLMAQSRPEVCPLDDQTMWSHKRMLYLDASGSLRSRCFAGRGGLEELVGPRVNETVCLWFLTHP